MLTSSATKIWPADWAHHIEYADQMRTLGAAWDLTPIAPRVSDPPDTVGM